MKSKQLPFNRSGSHIKFDPNEIAFYKPAFLFILLSILFSILFSCNKLVEVDPPKSRITTTQVFSNKEQASSTIAGIFYQMANGSIPPHLYSGGISYYTGLSSDEHNLYQQSNIEAQQFNSNTILANNSIVQRQLWATSFRILYQVNAVREGLENSLLLADTIKLLLNARANFAACLTNFYLTNLYGNIPLVTTTNWRETSLLQRQPQSLIYEKVISELAEAVNLLPIDYNETNQERILPNKWAAKALLARLYLYTQRYDQAEKQASDIINSGLFSLVPVSDVFKPNSNEAIWQLKHDKLGPTFNGTAEGIAYIPPNNAFSPPSVYLTSSLLSAFAQNDNRKLFWTKEKIIGGNSYYYPYKYKVGPSDASSTGAYQEYNTVFRLAEQYLIRAEARCQQNNLAGAINDINIIRNRAGLISISAPLSIDEIASEILLQRRCEFFAEWGHRWLDLKRLKIAETELTKNKDHAVTKEALLYPIPVADLLANPNLDQNSGY